MIALSGRKIHIIDDDSHTILILRHFLDSKQYNITYSYSGKEALTDFESYTPDLILLDVRMPEMDGYQVCRNLKQNPRLKDIPVIFITASHETSELVKGFDAGGVDFISKPVNRAELLARINTHLELKISRDIIKKKNKDLEQEIENRTQAEERFRALSETTFEAVVFIHQGRIIEANRAAVLLLGLVTGKSPSPRIDSFTDEKGAIMLKKIFKSKDTVGPWEVTFFPPGEKSFHGLVQQKILKYKGRKVIVLAIRDITRQKEIDKEIFNAIMEAEENERKRFSRDMHDGLGALLSTLKIYVNLLQKENKNREEKEMLINEMKDTINKAVESARTIANNIMPSVLMDHGLPKALKSFTDALKKTGVIDVIYTSSECNELISSKIENHLYRIALELINNTLKHAEAKSIVLDLQCKRDVVLLNYKDDGKGFNLENKVGASHSSQGLKNILSRLNFLNGEGKFVTQPGAGFSFFVKVPL